jgi:hypothetical protein
MNQNRDVTKREPVEYTRYVKDLAEGFQWKLESSRNVLTKQEVRGWFISYIENMANQEGE